MTNITHFYEDLVGALERLRFIRIGSQINNQEFNFDNTRILIC